MTCSKCFVGKEIIDPCPGTILNDQNVLWWFRHGTSNINNLNMSEVYSLYNHSSTLSGTLTCRNVLNITRRYFFFPLTTFSSNTNIHY